MTRHAIIVCGSRDWTDYAAIREVLSHCPHDTVLIHGDARGADRLAAKAAAELGHFEVIAMPAQWERIGRGAGPQRNGEMLRVLLALRECGYDVAVHAFSLPGSIGTADMKLRASRAGVEVFEHGQP